MMKNMSSISIQKLNIFLTGLSGFHNALMESFILLYPGYLMGRMSDMNISNIIAAKSAVQDKASVLKSILTSRYSAAWLMLI